MAPSPSSPGRTAGTADTPWIGRLLERTADPEAERAAFNARRRMERPAPADEVAAAVVRLASRLSGSTTGTVLAVNGGIRGFRIRPRG